MIGKEVLNRLELAKAEIIFKIRKRLKQKKLSIPQAAKFLGIPKDTLIALLRREIEFNLEQLLFLLEDLQ